MTDNERKALADKIEAWSPGSRSPLVFIAHERRMIVAALRTPIGMAEPSLIGGPNKFFAGEAALRPAPADGVREALEKAANIAKTMREKHGSPTGDPYSNGVWDQGVRIEQAIRALASFPAPSAGDVK